MGLVIALASSLIGFVFAAQGSVNIKAEQLSDEQAGKISLAGHATNIGLSFAFILIAALIYPLSVKSSFFHMIYLMGTVGFSVNGFLVAFNLLPVMTFDGLKVFKWNIAIWLVSFVISGLIVVSATFVGAEYMVMFVAGI